MSLRERLKNNKNIILFFAIGLFFVSFDIIAIGLFNIGLLFQNIFDSVKISDRILFITFWALLWYAWETRKLKEEAIIQTEIEQKPVMMLYVRNLIPDTIENILKREYVITDRASYCLSLRNVGRGPAFNVKAVEIKDRDSTFVVEKYQCRFFAPEPRGDEQAIKVIKKDNSKIESYNELKNIIFKVSCKSVDGRLHAFQYKIIDIEKQEVEYLDK